MYPQCTCVVRNPTGTDAVHTASAPRCSVFHAPDGLTCGPSHVMTCLLPQQVQQESFLNLRVTGLLVHVLVCCFVGMWGPVWRSSVTLPTQCTH